MPGPAFLMCRPSFYGVEYEINPWMHLRRQPNRPLALRQWEELRRTLEVEMRAKVHIVRARPGLPDMTFAANAGLVRGRDFVPARFRYRERAGEEPYYTNWFRRNGYRVVRLPEEVRFEGEGDALFVGGRLIVGYSFRSDFPAHDLLAKLFHVRVHIVALIDPHFYHLDTCFAPISPTTALYYPSAFDSYGIRVLKDTVGDLIPVDAEEALQFGCNAVVVGGKAIVSRPCKRIARELQRRSYTVYPLDFSEFLKAGGAAKCLVLRIR